MMNKGKLIPILLILFLFVFTAVWKFTNESQQPELRERADLSHLQMFWGHHNRATEFLNLTQYDSAAVFYEKALAINPEHEGVLYYLGSSRLFLREYDEAKTHWSKLAEINPLSVRARLQLGNLYFCMTPDNIYHDLNRSRSYFHEAHLLNREDTGPQLKLAKISLLQNRLSDAEEHINVVLSVNHLSYQGLFIKAYLYWLEGDHTAATETVQRAAQLYQNLTTTVIHGEGETLRGARAMLAEDRFCDLFEIEIGRILAEFQTASKNDDHHFSQFHQMMDPWMENNG